MSRKTIILAVVAMISFAIWFEYYVQHLYLDIARRMSKNYHVNKNLANPLDVDSLNVTEKLMNLVEETLAPWLPFPGSNDKLLHLKMFEKLERIGYGMGARVRIFEGRVFFRQVMRWTHKHYYARLRFHLNITHEVVKMSNISNTEFFIGVGDGPRVADDSSAPIPAFPIFSYMTSPAHIDVLIPDPLEMGAYGFRYSFKTEPPDIPWENKTSQLYFRGALTSFRVSSHNWNLSPRVRAALLSQRNASVYNMRLTRWSHAATADAAALQADTGLQLAPPAPLEQQCAFKWNLNLDGGWGSSRITSILRCGSLLVQPRSQWVTLSSKLLTEDVHYVAVDRQLRSLGAVVDRLLRNDGAARRMAAAARRVGDALLSRDAALRYWALLLRRWAGLFRPGQDFAPRDSEWDHCGERGTYAEALRTGPLNCSRGWLEFTSLAAFDAHYRDFPLEA